MKNLIHNKLEFEKVLDELKLEFSKIELSLLKKIDKVIKEIQDENRAYALKLSKIK